MRAPSRSLVAVAAAVLGALAAGCGKPPADLGGDPHASPESVTRAWARTVRASEWKRLAALYAPQIRRHVEEDLARLSHGGRTSLRATADRVDRALGAGAPAFAPSGAPANRTPAGLAVHRWDYCAALPREGAPPPACEVLVGQAEGRWYVLEVD